ncbi:hypothetical protein WJX72_011999 [[Myrmecia] bisecta]|uniref:Uncharacterized protein n=1 Tax=[Myrmecia] bisecta TaxID=41462 RepID=A0AAW1PIE6_9CHLO
MLCAAHPGDAAAANTAARSCDGGLFGDVPSIASAVAAAVAGGGSSKAVPSIANAIKSGGPLGGAVAAALADVIGTGPCQGNPQSFVAAGASSLGTDVNGLADTAARITGNTAIGDTIRKCAPPPPRPTFPSGTFAGAAAGAGGAAAAAIAGGK